MRLLDCKVQHGTHQMINFASHSQPNGCSQQSKSQLDVSLSVTADHTMYVRNSSGDESAEAEEFIKLPASALLQQREVQLLGFTDEFECDGSEVKVPKPAACNDSDVSSSTLSGEVWCVNVPHDDHLIVVRRVTLMEDGVVKESSRAVIVGNCGEGLDYKAMGSISRREELRR